MPSKSRSTATADAGRDAGRVTAGWIITAAYTPRKGSSRRRQSPHWMRRGLRAACRFVARAFGEVGAPSRPSGASLAGSRLSAPEGRAAPRPRQLTRAPAAFSVSGHRGGAGESRSQGAPLWEVAIGVPVPEIVSGYRRALLAGS